MTAAEFIHYLEARGLTPRKTSSGWEARCPGHDDRNASLSIAEGKDGRILLKCFAGCSVEFIVGAVGLQMSDLFPAPTRAKRDQESQIVATYDYRDEEGKLLFQCVRFDPKDFRQRRPDPARSGHWLWNLKETRRVLYRLPEVIEAVKAGRTLFVTEGEKDVDALVKHGCIGTCNPCGAGKWRSDYNSPLTSANVVVLPDKDKPGRKHADEVANSLHGKAASVRVIELPDRNGRKVKDAHDWITAGGTAEELSALVDAAPEYELRAGPKPTEPGSVASDDLPDDDSADEESTNASGRLVAIALEHMELFHAPDKTRYGRVRVCGHKEVWAIKGADAKEWLAGAYFAKTGKAINAAALSDAINVLSCKARFEGQCIDVHLRVAPYKTGIVIDLGDREWSAIVVDENGWQVVKEHPVMFIRSANMLPLPEPSADPDFGKLWNYLNVDVADRPLVAGWLLADFHPRGPYPILALAGQQGSAKSFSLRLLRSLTDPSTVELPAAPKDERDLIVSARSRRLLAFDNLSHMPPALADALCRVATGGGLSVRQLYTDGEEFSLSIRRPVAFNGIPDLLARGDLAERSIRVELHPIDETARREEDELLDMFRDDLPSIFAGLLDGLAACVRNYPTVRLGRRPRMADAAKWIAAGEGALGFDEGSFVTAFFENQADSARMVVEASAIGAPVLALLKTEGRLEYSPSALLARLNETADEAARRDSHWPRQAHNLSATIKRIAPALKQLGVHVEFERTRDSRLIKIVRVGEPASPASQGTTPNDARDARDAVPAPFTSNANDSYDAKKHPLHDGTAAEHVETTVTRPAEMLL